MGSKSDSLQLGLLHESVEENLVKDQHVSVLRCDLLNPLDLNFVGSSVIFDGDLRQILFVH